MIRASLAVLALGSTALRKPTSLEELLRRPEVNFAAMQQAFDLEATAEVAERVEIIVKYAGYITRQVAEAERFRRLEDERLPDSIDYRGLPGLSREVQEKLGRLRPRSLGQAARISGVTPAAVSILLVHARAHGARNGNGLAGRTVPTGAPTANTGDQTEYER